MFLKYHPTPVQTLEQHPIVRQSGIRLLIKREDLNHPLVSGNKWWKLKYNFLEAQNRKESAVLTFGGAYSNHIYATAAAAAGLGFRSHGMIRGEETLPLNATLDFARKQGMDLHYISRTDYRRANDPDFIDGLRKKFGPFYFLPEGGSNLLAVKGCAEFAEQELSTVDFEHLYLAVGTGGTMAGLICGLKEKTNLVGVSVLKDGGFLKERVSRFCLDFAGATFQRWNLLLQYHQGGYAKTNDSLRSFLKEMQSVYQLPLDGVYTGKLLWAILQEAQEGKFRRGETILALHTGGLQGIG